jgi:acyl-CoA synthetase (AMP-forming)/AMP-acid ligase II
MACWMNLGQITKLNAKKYPETIALKDCNRQFTYPQLNQRINRLAHALLGLELEKGDKVAVLLENSIEIVEIFLAAAKTGLVVVPINFRLVGPEVAYIINNSDAKVFIVHDEFVGTVNQIKPNLTGIGSENYIVVGEKANGFIPYEDFITPFVPDEPESDVLPQDPWILIYTSGTTGKPKGVVRSHESHIAFYLINAIDFGFTPMTSASMSCPCAISIQPFLRSHSRIWVLPSTFIRPALSSRMQFLKSLKKKKFRLSL